MQFPNGMRTLTVAITLALAVAAAGPAAADPAPGDRILSHDQYTSDKARQLATTHAGALRQLNAGVYHCLPWLEVQKQSIGFFRPKGASQDERYLSMRVFVEQDAGDGFARLAVEQRSAAMFSRYVPPLLRRMAADRTLLGDPAVDGFTLIVEWLKPARRGEGDRPVHETIAIFIPKATADAYLAGRLTIGELAAGARVLAWDGETALGSLQLQPWDDDFVATYRVANYEPAAGVTCP